MQQEDQTWTVAARPNALDWLNHRLLERVIHSTLRYATGHDTLTVRFVACDLEPIAVSPAPAGTPFCTEGVPA